MNNTHRRRVGAKVTLALLSVFIILILLVSTVSSQMLGDVNFDGVVDIRDVVLVQRHILGYQPPLTSAQLTAADVNGDGVVNVVDVNLMMQYIQGYINSFPTHHLHAPVLISPVEGASVDGSMVSFQWGAVTGATRYQLELTKVSDGTVFRTVDLGNFTSTTQEAFANDGAEYRWRVRAGSITQWGAWSLQRTFTNGAALPAPTLGAPANNASLDSESINFQWSAVTGATRYQLEVVRVSDSFVFKNIELGNTTSASQGVFPNNGTDFRWRVRAGNAHAWGAWSVYRNFTSGVTLPAPTLSSPTNNSAITGSSVLFHWNAVSGATKYHLEVFRGTESVPFKDVTVGNIMMSEQFGFQHDGATYSWRVRAGNNSGWGAWSGYFKLTSGSLPVAPTLTSPAAATTVVGTQISFQWNAVGVATMYEIEIFNDNNSALFSRTLVNNATTSMQRGFPDDGTKYKWRVKAASKEGWGPWSEYRYFTNGNPPNAPALIRPVDNENIYGNRVMFEWRPVPGADHYKLQIKKGSEDPKIIDVGYAFAWTERDLPNDGSVYKWKVWAGNVNGGNWSAERTFINGSQFAFPVLLTPSAFSTQTTETIEFSWKEVTKATKYHLEVVDFVSGAIFASKEDIPGTTHSLNSFVPADHRQYKWRVRAGSGTEWGLWSSYYDFISQDEVNPAAPSLLSPASGATATGDSITFTWTNSGLGSTYHLQVIKASGEDVIINNDTIDKNSFTSAADSFPDDGTVFLWRVRAKTNGSFGAWSFYRSFTNGSHWWNFSF